MSYKQFAGPLFLVLLLSGCMKEKKRQIPFVIPDYAVTNVAHQSPRKPVMRVVVFPLTSWDESIATTDLQALTQCFRERLLTKTCFECIFVNEWPEENCLTGLSQAFLEKWRKDYDADGLLWVGLTHYAPYVPLKLGVRAQLLEISTARILWMVEELFDSQDDRVERHVKDFQTQNTFETLNNLGQLSPRFFGTYVADKIWSTLPRAFR